jgi:predicted GNAT superfamily acetyltransferase
MAEHKPKAAITIRDLQSINDLKQVEGVERKVWGLSDLDTMPLTFTVASREAGAIWLGAFDGSKMVGFAFGFLGANHGQLNLHSHMLAVLEPYRTLNLGYKLKLAQRERVLALRGNGLRAEEITWTFDPLQSRNAHLNFAKLGVIADQYKVDFYGPETSSILHRNGTDRLWVRWPITSRRVQERVQGKRNRAEVLDALSTVLPLVRFNGDGKPARTDLQAALRRQRVVIEIPGHVFDIEKKDPELARQWRLDTRWAFTEVLAAGFFVAEFCRRIRGQQGPGAYLLEKGNPADYVPEMARAPIKI